MDVLQRRKLKYYLRLNYPMEVVFHRETILGRYPDLPGVEVQHPDLEEVKSRLDRLRRDWLTERVTAGDDPPMPNTHEVCRA